MKLLDLPFTGNEGVLLSLQNPLIASCYLVLFCSLKTKIMGVLTKKILWVAILTLHR